MKKIVNLLIFAFIILTSGFAQKIPIDYTVYDSWKNLNNPLISEDGKWITYTITPQQGDGWLYVYNVATGRKDSVARGGRAVFSSDSRYLVYQVIPTYAETRQAKKKKLKDDKMPKNNLQIMMLPGMEVTNINRVKSFALAEKNSFWMAYIHEKKLTEPAEKKASGDTTRLNQVPVRKKAKTSDPKGTEMVLFNPVLKKEFRYQDVVEYVVSKDGKSISYIQNIPDTSKIEKFIVNVFDTRNESSTVIFEGKGSIKKLSADRNGNIVSFIYSSDTAKVKVYDLWLSRDAGKAGKIVDSSNPAMPAKWSVSENGNISFSDDATRIFFGTAVKPVKVPEDTLLDEEKYKLDIWSWSDDLLQPMQKKQLDQEKKRTWLAVYDLNKGRMLQLADTSIPSVQLYQKGNSRIALGSSDLKYRRSSSWDGRAGADYYIVDITTGSKKLIEPGGQSRVFLSPSCKFIIYWDNLTRGWIAQSVAGTEKKLITSSVNVPLFDELNDVPDDPSPYGIACWTEDEKRVLIYDRYDIWSVDPEGNEPAVNFTNSFGRTHNMRLRYSKLDPDAETIAKGETMYLTAFNYENKEAGFYSIKSGKSGDPVRLVMRKASFPGDLLKAKKADILVWQQGTFEKSPELYFSKMSFDGETKISVTNPQQFKYNWGTVELIDWVSFDRQKLQGLLYRPEDFDPGKNYPMIIYFYERSSDGLYSYIPPVPSASRINITSAVSNGYLIFVPDIPYTTGYPGQSCYNAVVSGTYSLLDKFKYIDRNRLGLDGQSWGGYQIAWLVTQTDMFACAYAGAAVSNMTSAYGGIRWESGMSRMFQYEHQQSRIGGTLWDRPVQFIENSPIFFVPKINTPLLLMNNDADGAVPWYQGIEFITALRRLDKPAWMLSYNDEAHNLVNRPNKVDITIRKMQFFDHYLKGAPMPYWMKYGISQTEKGKINGYDLVK